VRKPQELCLSTGQKGTQPTLTTSTSALLHKSRSDVDTHQLPLVSSNGGNFEPFTLFDHKLSFLPHLRYLKNKCLNVLNLIRVVTHTSWGADQQTLLHLYRSLIRSKLDCGCIQGGPKKTAPNFSCNNFGKYRPILIMFHCYILR